MTTISSKSLKASRLALDPTKRGDTFELRYPRAIHAEFMTHRVFGRNASSSRAIPVKRLIEDVMTDPFVPLHWGKNQKGMQAFEQNDALVSLSHCACDFLNTQHTNEKAWLYARDQAVKVAEAFDAAGYHKQVINRLLEPWAHINVVATASQLANFFHLRDHPAAEPHIRILAGEMKHSFTVAEVQDIWPGEWHLPYIGTDDDGWDVPLIDYIKLSVARCASVSYKTVDGKPMTMEQANRIYDQLLADVPIHASPAEHQFTSDEQVWDSAWNGLADKGGWMWKNPTLGGNLGPGFIQYRKTLVNENLIEMPDDILNAA